MTSVELQTILDCSFGSPCIDPIFGPTASDYYWSASTVTAPPANAAWIAGFFGTGVMSSGSKTVSTYVRAVRAGSCR